MSVCACLCVWRHLIILDKIPFCIAVAPLLLLRRTVSHLPHENLCNKSTCCLYKVVLLLLSSLPYSHATSSRHFNQITHLFYGCFAAAAAAYVQQTPTPLKKKKKKKNINWTRWLRWFVVVVVVVSCETTYPATACWLNNALAATTTTKATLENWLPRVNKGVQSSCVVRAHLRTLFLFSIEDITPNETTPVAELRESGNY